MSSGYAFLAAAATATLPEQGRGAPTPTRTRERIATLNAGILTTTDTAVVTPERALGLPAVYSAVRLITHTIDQLPLRRYQGQVTEPLPLPDWLRVPDRFGCDYILPDLVEYLVTCQATRGAAYLWCTPSGDSWRVDPIDPSDVSVELVGPKRMRTRAFKVDGESVPRVTTYGRRSAGLLPMPFLVVPGLAAGVGPIQAARAALHGYLSVDGYAADAFGSGRTFSGGYLSTDQDIDEDTATAYRDKLVERNADTAAPPLVLGNGLTWQTSALSPADAQWIEARQFNAQEVCRMYGIPPRYLGLPSGDSTTYATARDNDAQLLRTCVSGYTNTIAHGLSQLLPPGRNADEDQRVGFDFDAWLGTPAAAPPAATPPGQEVPQP